VIPPFALVHLLGLEPGPLSFRSGRVACGGNLSGTLGRLICNSCLRFFPLNTAPVVHILLISNTHSLFPSLFDTDQHSLSAIRPNCNRQTAGREGHTEAVRKKLILIGMTPAVGLMHFRLGARIMLHSLYHTLHNS
jgi:hypothetical protein